MAQSLAPESRTTDLSKLIDNRSVGATAEGGVSAVVSAGVSASVESEVNEASDEDRQFTIDKRGPASLQKREHASLQARTPCTGSGLFPNSTAYGRHAVSQENGRSQSQNYGTRLSLHNCELQKRGKKLTTEPPAALRAYRPLGGQLGHLPLPAEKSAALRPAGIRARMAEDSGASEQLRLGDSATSYSTDFPDSTRGTGMVSPPDIGAVSPLEWNPKLSVGLQDFASTHTFSPSLHVFRRPGQNRNGRSGSFWSRRSQSSWSQVPIPPPSSPQDTEPKSDLPDWLRPSFDAVAPSVDSSLPTSVDQQ